MCNSEPLFAQFVLLWSSTTTSARTDCESCVISNYQHHCHVSQLRCARDCPKESFLSIPIPLTNEVVIITLKPCKLLHSVWELIIMLWIAMKSCLVHLLITHLCASLSPRLWAYVVECSQLLGDTFIAAKSIIGASPFGREQVWLAAQFWISRSNIMSGSFVPLLGDCLPVK